MAWRCGHLTVTLHGGYCDPCYLRMQRENATRQSAAREAQRKAKGETQVPQVVRPVQRLSWPAPAVLLRSAFGTRTCERCRDRFEARAEAQRHCSMWCAYPRV